MRLRSWSPRGGASTNHPSEDAKKRDPPARGQENNGRAVPPQPSSMSGNRKDTVSPNQHLNGLSPDPPDSNETVTFYPIRLADRQAYMEGLEPDSPPPVRRVEI